MVHAQGGNHRDRGEHTVRAAGQRRQHGLRIGGVIGFAEDAAAQADRGVGGQHRRVGQGPALAAAQRGFGLQRADALHVVVRSLAGQDGFQRFGVLVVIGKQQLVACTQLGQQFAAARALGGEVEVVVHRGRRGRGLELPAAGRQWREL
ncbi:hypothetical protein D9M72_396280 [compost metagenome]